MHRQSVNLASEHGGEALRVRARVEELRLDAETVHQRADLVVLEPASAHRLVLAGVDHLERRQVHEHHAQLDAVLVALAQPALLSLEGDRLRVGDCLERRHERVERLLVERLLLLQARLLLQSFLVGLLHVLLPLLLLLLLLGELRDALVPRLVHHLAELDGHALGDALDALRHVGIVVQDDLHLHDVLLADVFVVHPHHQVVELGHQLGRARRVGRDRVDDLLVRPLVVLLDLAVLIHRHVHVAHDLAHLFVLCPQLLVVGAQLLVLGLHLAHLLELALHPLVLGHHLGHVASFCALGLHRRHGRAHRRRTLRHNLATTRRRSTAAAAAAISTNTISSSSSRTRTSSSSSTIAPAATLPRSCRCPSGSAVASSHVALALRTLRSRLITTGCGGDGGGGNCSAAHTAVSATPTASSRSRSSVSASACSGRPLSVGRRRRRLACG
mmetsp:Transcript_52097/g.113480  ORF Transcript_52097/g.113480 Transcript_52097/m.113480 type:complete len:444 (+) Transcript_52097:703-2034(+)